MRNFEERKAEIFRRSREHIDKQKKTRKILFSLLPLFVCTVLLSAVLVIPKLSDKATNEEDAEVYDGAQATSYSYNCIFVEVKNENGYYRKIDNIIELKGVLDTFYSSYNYGLAVESKEDPQEDSIGSTNKTDEYIIVFTAQDLSRREFTFSGNKLIDMKDGKEYSLTNEQQNAIIEILEIPKE